MEKYLQKGALQPKSLGICRPMLYRWATSPADNLTYAFALCLQISEMVQFLKPTTPIVEYSCPFPYIRPKMKGVFQATRP